MYKKVPTTLQMQSADCGAASLKMLMDFFSIEYSLEEIRTSIGIGRDGSTLGDIRRAAEGLGFKLEAKRIELGDLDSEVPPYILWWNSNHFVVYEGIIRDRFSINDPAVGRRLLSPEEFTEGFTGVVLQPVDVKTSKAFHSDRIRSSKELLISLLSKYEINISLVLGLSLISVIPTIATSQLTSYYIDSVIGQNNTLVAKPLLWLLFLLSGLIALLNYLSFSIAGTTVYVSATTKTIDFLRDIFDREYSWFSNRQPTEISTRISIPSKQLNSCIYDFTTSASVLLSGLVITLVLLLTSFPLGLFTLLVLIATFAISYLIGKNIDSENRLVSIEGGKQQGLSLMTLQEIFLVRTSGLETQRFATWAGYYTNFVNSQYAVSSSLNIVGLASRSAFYVLNIGLIVIGPLLIIEHMMTLGGFISASYLMGMVTSSVVSIPNLLASIQEIISPLDRLKDVYEAQKQSSIITTLYPGPSQPNNEPADTLKIENLTFAFSPQNTPIESYNLTLPLGGIISITGQAGSGKSVLVKLLCNLYTPTTGNIGWICNDKSSPPLITYIPQKPTIIEGSVLDNIAFGSRSISHKACVTAARNAGLLSSSITCTGFSLNTHLPFGGASISLSIMQRIFLARAFAARSSSILILDYFYSEIETSEFVASLLNLRDLYKTVFVVTPLQEVVNISEQLIEL